MKKLIGLVALVLTLVASSITASGCAQADSNEQIIRQSLSQELDSIKNVDPSFLGDINSQLGTDFTAFEEIGISPEEFMRGYLEGFDYTIDSIQVDGNTAVAKVTITCKSYSDFENKMSKAATELFTNADDFSGLTSEQLSQTIGEALLNTLQTVELTQTEPVEIDYTLEGNTWVPDSDTETAIASALMTN